MSHAVAPVPWRKASLKPLPKASDRAIFPVSCRNGTVPTRVAGSCRPSFQAKPTRAPMATTTISGSETSSLRQASIGCLAARAIASGGVVFGPDLSVGSAFPLPVHCRGFGPG